MYSVRSVEKMSSAFSWASEEASIKVRQSLEKGSCVANLEARIFFVAQIISSIVAIPFISISSFFILLSQLAVLDLKNAFYTISATLISASQHIHLIFASMIAVVAPLDWTDKSLGIFHCKHANFSIEKMNAAFHWGGQEAIRKIQISLKEDRYTPGFQARIIFAAQMVSSIVAIPFLLISSSFVLMWKVSHFEIKKALFTITSAINFSSVHIATFFKSAIAVIAPLSCTNKTRNCFVINVPE